MTDVYAKTLWNFSDTLSAAADSCVERDSVPVLKDAPPTYLVKLELYSREGTLLSENLYALSEKEDLSLLATLPKVMPEKQVTVSERGEEYLISVVLTNKSEGISFFNRLAVCGGDGQEVAPVIWSDNFVTLMPGEQRTLTAVVAKSDVKGQPAIVIEH
jgi:exo-1,4-beta-D-glucosaminidase